MRRCASLLYLLRSSSLHISPPPPHSSLQVPSRLLCTHIDPSLREFAKAIASAGGSMDSQQLHAALHNFPADWTSRAFFYKVLNHIVDPETALNFFLWVTDHKNFLPSTSEYNAILEVLGSAQMFTSMKMVMKRMDMKKCTILPSTFTILIKYYVKAGLVDDAVLTLEQMKRCGVRPNVQTYNNLMDAFVREGKIDRVLGMCQQMKSDGIQPNEYTLNFLVEGLCSSGQHDKAKEIVQESTTTNNIVYNVLLKGFCRANKINEAHEIIQEMISKGCLPDEYSYNTLIVGACKAGEIDFALRMRAEMIERKISPNLITYGTLIMFLCRHKRSEEAYQLLAEMKSEGILLTEQDQSSLKTAFLRSNRRTSAAILIRDMGCKSSNAQFV